MDQCLSNVSRSGSDLVGLASVAWRLLMHPRCEYVAVQTGRDLLTTLSTAALSSCPRCGYFHVLHGCSQPDKGVRPLDLPTATLLVLELIIPIP